MEDSCLNNSSILNNNHLKFEINYFYNLDSENKICFDCGGPFPCFISINNGVFICKFCAENHRKNLNYNISFIYDINSEFDQYLLSFVKRGGNSRFKRLCNQYEVPCMSLSQNNSEKINKYIIRLGEYHRLLLKSEIDCSEPPPPLYRENAHEPINVNIIYFPEFENYHLFQGNNISKSGISNNNINRNEIRNDNNVDDSMKSKIWEGTKNTFDVVKTTGEIIYNTSKPIVSFIGNAAFTGIKYIGNSVWNYYMNNNNNENKDKNNDKDNNTIGNNTNINNNISSNKNNFNDNINNNGNMSNVINYNNNNNFYPNNSNIYNNKFPNNKNYLVNSNKFTIFTINDDKPQNNINISNQNHNQINQFYSKPIPNNEINNRNKKDNKIPYFYDINSINNESINNISYYLNNNINTINDITKAKNNLLNHKNIIINNKYINNKNILENNPNNNVPNNNLPNNNYPSYSSFEKNMLLDKNKPNIIGEEIFQEEEKYPIYQSNNLLNENSFTPKEFDANNEN